MDEEAVPGSIVMDEEIDPDYVPTEEEVIEYAKWLGMDPVQDRDLYWIARYEWLHSSNINCIKSFQKTSSIKQ